MLFVFCQVTLASNQPHAAAIPHAAGDGLLSTPFTTEDLTNAVFTIYFVRCHG